MKIYSSQLMSHCSDGGVHIKSLSVDLELFQIRSMFILAGDYSRHKLSWAI